MAVYSYFHCMGGWKKTQDAEVRLKRMSPVVPAGRVNFRRPRNASQQESLRSMEETGGL